jgi:hypothetical protein
MSFRFKGAMILSESVGFSCWAIWLRTEAGISAEMMTGAMRTVPEKSYGCLRIVLMVIRPPIELPRMKSGTWGWNNSK